MLDTEIKVTPELAAEHGLTAEEYARIQKILRRDPNFTELGIFSVMWSEHCSYKSSKVHLRRLPTRAPQVLQGPGENAGVVDIGDGLAAAFKMESHNHPSYVEPFQGAATGVGGILRDIFTMGARPIAVLDSLRFGPISAGTGAKAPDATPLTAGLKPGPTNLPRNHPATAPGSPAYPQENRASLGSNEDIETQNYPKATDRPSSTIGPPGSTIGPPSSTTEFPSSIAEGSSRFVGTGFSPSEEAAKEGALAPGSADDETIVRNRRILDGVVRGIAHYGNCFGVPTVGGEVQFEPGYSANPLVNVLALGIARKEDLFFAKARGAGNPVIYVGAKTGRDGIHGASLLASAEFTEESQQKRPNVQVGDPFMEKLLLEACLEAMQTGGVVAIQDMGAAGLTSTSCEMASRGGLGIEIELARVPQRESGMTPYEMMLSESQERMLLVAERGREQEVLSVFAKWGLDAVEIGSVTEDGLVRVLHQRHVVAEIPAHALAEEGPVYKRPLAAPEPVTSKRLIEFAASGTDLTANFRKLLTAPSIASKRWIWEQYDYMVRTNTLEAPGAGDAAVVRIKGTKRALALSSDGNGRWCRLDPFVGAQLAVAEAARNVACSGAKPWAATNCLNFGNPEKPEVMWQFSRAIDGIAEACTVLEIPITGGNVSFYNETLGRSIDPTPVLGILGMIEDASRTLGMGFRAQGDAIVLLDGRGTEASGASVIGRIAREFSSSEYARTIRGIESGAPPAVDLAAEKRLIALLVALAGEGALQSAHDVSDGGLAVALAESCFGSSGLSAQISLTSSEPDEAALFSEQGARAVVSVNPVNLARVRSLAAQYGVAALEVGRVARGDFRIELIGRAVVSADISPLADVWTGAIERVLRDNDFRKGRMNGLIQIDNDRFHDHCGVCGVFGHPEAAKLAYLGLYALQHRGQESAGIVSSDGRELHIEKSLGLVADIFQPEVLARLPGEAALGHTRYSTAGDTSLMNAQPIVIDCNKGKLALGHNGNLPSAAKWRRTLEHRGSIFQTTSDTEVIVHLVARSQARNLSGALADALNQVEGAYSLLVLTRDEMYALRDPRGFRPLALGQLDGAWVVASETCAFDLIGATYVRDVEPGEMLRITRAGIESLRFAPEKPLQHCIFEHVYFARPDSLVFGRVVEESREMLGRLLALEHPVPADIVVPVPDSGVPAAIGYSLESGVPFRMGLIRNHYVGRTFIEPQQAIRDFGVKLKLNPVRGMLEGKRVVLVDDSIVRGTTSRKIVRLVRDAGATEVHMRISCPPTISPCYYGVDTPTREELIAADDSHVRPRLTPEEFDAFEGKLDSRQRSIEEIRRYLGADSLGYLSIESLRRAVGDSAGSYCTSCYTGVYPVDGAQAELDSRAPAAEGQPMVEIQAVPK